MNTVGLERGQLQAPAALPPAEGVAGKNWIGDLVGPTVGLDVSENPLLENWNTIIRSADRILVTTTTELKRFLLKYQYMV